MFIYLSKKIAIPNNTKLNCLAWMKDNGYIAVGGEDGLLKVLKLESAGGASSSGRSAGLAAPSNLSMNQSLEGHSGPIQVAVWNETHHKLTTSDKFGVIIVWMLYKGSWYEEMINNRNKSTVTGMAWNSDGQKICIVYEDGCVILGSVDGNRIWGKELKGIALSGVQWSPDGKLLIFSIKNGELHLYDNQGTFARKIVAQCIVQNTNRPTPIVGLEWYSGPRQVDQPVLTICYKTGLMQIMRGENDNNPVIVDTDMQAVACSWNHSGTILAVAGIQTEGDREGNVVQFYTPYGEHVRTLKVPGREISACTWEGGSLRIALAVDSYIYFANIRPDYKWTYFMKTVVFVNQTVKEGTSITFWDTVSHQCYLKNVSSLLSIASYLEHCVLAVRCDNVEQDTVNANSQGSGQYGLLLCNTISTVVDAKYMDLEPQWVAMNSTHVVACSCAQFLIWQYRTPKGAALHVAGKRKDRKYHVDDTPSGVAEVIQDLDRSYEPVTGTGPTMDPICSLAISDTILILGRESGVLQRYSLPQVALTHRYTRSTRSYTMSINCNSTRLSIIDVTGMMTMIELEQDDDNILTKSLSAHLNQKLDTTRSDVSAISKVERKDVWAMCWATDNPQLIAIMEKTRMYVLRGSDPEEPISSSGYICSFHDLEIRAVLLDDVVSGVVTPGGDQLLDLEVKSLRDTRELLNKVGIKEASQFIQDNPHPRLWRLLAEASVQLLDLDSAEAAFVRCADYPGIQLCKKLKNIQNDQLKKAEVAAYFKKFDEAEKLYLDSDRRDLGIGLRQSLGDWFRVLQLMRMGVGGSDLQVEQAFNCIGDYFAERQNWENAKEYYEKSRNQEKLIQCYYSLEDYDALEGCVTKLQDRNPLLNNLGQMLASVGMCSQAVNAYIKYGDIKSAVDTCVGLNQWDQAVALAQRYKMPQIGALMAKYANHLLENNKVTEAVELYRKANRFLDAARLMQKLANAEAEKRSDPLRIKKLYVLAGLLIEDHLNLSVIDSPRTGAARGMAMLGVGLSPQDLAVIESSWRGAEAFHFLLLSQRQLYGGLLDNAMKTALRLREYEDILCVEDLYCILALTSAANRSFATCSKAFIKLEGLTQITETKRQEYEDLAVEIFTKNPPKDSRTNRMECVSCETLVPDWCTTCPSCSVRFPGCLATGRPLPNPNNVWRCSKCRRCACPQEMMLKKCCPLCHAVVHV